jgi:predicted kinase
MAGQLTLSNNSDLIQVLKNALYRADRRIENAKLVIDDAEIEKIGLKRELLDLGVELPLGE